jgi:holo-[acyl-carrier protein] synthase
LIIGLGVDIAEVPRVKAAIERRGELFLRRVFTPGEIEYCERFKNNLNATPAASPRRKRP